MQRLRSFVRSSIMLSLLLWPVQGTAHNVYMANENHTDYGWNDTTDHYDASMLSELDYYLDRIDMTAGAPDAEQARFNADCWWYLYLYQRNRSPGQFQRLINAMLSEHIRVPLNPLVTLYGALPTEAAIRAGYYPGRIERQYGVSFLVAEEMENATIPWGVASLWAGSRGKYSWKGICDCPHVAPSDQRTAEVFRWRGSDGKELLMKWYLFSGDNRSWGGYAEARDNLSADGIQATIARDTTPPRNYPASGVFGYGWDDVNSQITGFETVVSAWNKAHANGDHAVVSNIVDYFRELEQSKNALPILQGGWGNDWDLWPAALSARTSQARRAIERLRTVEILAAFVHLHDGTFWPPHQSSLEAGLIDFFKYFEHTWNDGGVGLGYVVNNKKVWSQHIDDAVAQADGDATAAVAALFQTPPENRFIVINPLGFVRTDYADLAVTDSGAFVVTDVATGLAVPSQMITTGGSRYLRILASNVPALGYRTYRYAAAAPSALGDAATVTGNRIENDHYRLDLGSSGQITSALDKTTGREMAGSGLNDFGGGVAAAPTAENVGPVSATIRADVSGTPARTVRVTLFRNIDRIEIDDDLPSNYTATGTYRFNVNLPTAHMHFEEVGAVAQPGLTTQGGNFLPGTRSDFMTLNHFVNFSDGAYQVILSNWDAYIMRVGSSNTTSFDLSVPEVSVLATGNPADSGIVDQGGDSDFHNRFALRGVGGAYSGALSMMTSLAHTNPLRTVALPSNHTGPVSAPSAGLLSISAPNVVVTAFKPTEEGLRGLLLRVWELDGTDTAFTIDASSLSPTAAFEVSLIETDTGQLPVTNGLISTSIAANEIKAYRLVPGAVTSTATPTTTASETSSASATPSQTPTPSPTGSPSSTISATATATTVLTATPTPSPRATSTATPTATTTPKPSATVTATLLPITPSTTPTLGTVRGDINGDGSVNAADLFLLARLLFEPGDQSAADVNQDGRVTAADVPALIGILGSS